MGQRSVLDVLGDRVSILAPVGTALLGLAAGQTIEWDFPDGAHRRLHVDQVIHRDCPINAARG
jgi:regulator of nucleoside diphosphate kinase